MAVTLNKAVGVMPVPTRDGFAFKGWFTDKDAGTEVTAATVYATAGDSTVHAHWTPSNQTLVFDPNGTAAAPATVSPTSKAVAYDTAIGDMPVPTRNGFTFNGWFTEKDAGTEITKDTVYKTNGPTTVYAHWTANGYVMTFDPNGGEAVKPATLNVTYGEPIGALPTGTRKGYTFKGWFTAKEGGLEVKAGDPYATADNSIVYAQWVGAPYTLTLHVNGGDPVTPGSLRVTYGLPVGVMPTPTRTGYTFGGWYTDATAGTAITAATVYQLEQDSAAYAHWTKNVVNCTVTVRYLNRDNGNVLHTAAVFPGLPSGSAYDVTAATTLAIANYTRVYVDGTAAGTVTGDLTISVYYRVNTAPPAPPAPTTPTTTTTTTTTTSGGTTKKTTTTASTTQTLDEKTPLGAPATGDTTLTIQLLLIATLAGVMFFLILLLAKRDRKKKAHATR